MVSLNVEKLQHFIDAGRIDPAETITLKVLRDSGAVGRFKHGVKLLGGNTTALTAQVNIEVSQASAGAIRAIEEAGGKIVTVYHAPLALRAHLKPDKFAILPKSPTPPPKLMDYYTNDDNRGYLSQKVQLDAAKERIEAES